MTRIGTLVLSADPNEQPYWKETVKQFNCPTCHKHNLLLPNGFCDVCTAEELSKRLRKREMNQEQKKEGDSRSFEDMFLEAHGMKPKKEERIEEMRLRQTPSMDPAAFKAEAQRVTPIGSFCSDGYHVSNEEKQRLRTKALELALSSFGGNVAFDDDGVVKTAQRFYTYITKGE